MKERFYIAIDLKSFFASVECQERELDPLGTNLVVADQSRTEKTICLAVSPSLKAYGIPGRARLFEVVQKVKEVKPLSKNRRCQTNCKKTTEYIQAHGSISFRSGCFRSFSLRRKGLPGFGYSIPNAGSSNFSPRSEAGL